MSIIGLYVVMVKDHFPIPIVEELLDELVDTHIFLKLNLRSGYPQLCIHPSNIEKTTFRMHDGHYEELIMPFGLLNAPSTFQELINSIFWPTLTKFTLVFFNDVLVYSASWEEHTKHLKTIFDLFRSHKLHAKLSKYAFGYPNIDYLGH